MKPRTATVAPPCVLAPADYSAKNWLKPWRCTEIEHGDGNWQNTISNMNRGIAEFRGGTLIP